VQKPVREARHGARKKVNERERVMWLNSGWPGSRVAQAFLPVPGAHAVRKDAAPQLSRRGTGWKACATRGLGTCA
jgi:hypothetical protein